MTLQSFLSHRLATLNPSLPPLAIILLASILTAALITYIRSLMRRQRRTLPPRQDLEHISPASHPDDKHAAPPPPPSLSAQTQATYADLPPPLRTTLHTPLAGRPWTSAHLASHPWIAQDHHPSRAEPPTTATTHQPPTRVYVTDTLQFFPPSPPSQSSSPTPSSSSPNSRHAPSHRRRTLIFETHLTTQTAVADEQRGSSAQKATRPPPELELVEEFQEEVEVEGEGEAEGQQGRKGETRCRDAVQ